VPEADPERRALEALGLALRAGRAAVGTRQVAEAARSGELELVVWAGDASPNARRRISGPLKEAEPVQVTLGDRASLGDALGRAPVVVVGVSDRGLAAKIAGLAGRGAPPRGTAPPEPSGAPREE
jgi:ribosomal protein L7Ae-like RNA K-turn-binding protein